MKNLIFMLFAGVLFISVSCQSGSKKQETTETKSETVEETGWEVLFDGTSTEGWRGVNSETLPGAWTIVDGAFQCKGSGMGEAGAHDGGDILFDKKFSNFHLKIEWKISEGGNSGIFYLGQEIEGWPIWKTAPEMQVLDNEKHPDAMLGKNGNRQAGSLYDLVPAVPQNAKPVGEWNTCEIMVYKGTVIHKQNGEVVVEYHLWTEDWNAMVADSKFPGLNPDWANVAKEGYIGIQDHGDDVWFRNISIKEL
jgi:hypothetical protein